MGSPNFYTNTHPDYGLNVGYVNDGDDEYITSVIYNMVKEDIEDINSELLFGQIKLELGYHEGFQAYYRPHDEVQDIIDTWVEVREPDAYTDYTPEEAKELICIIDEQGYELCNITHPEIKNLAKVTITKNELDQNEMSYELDKEAIRQFVEHDIHKGLHFLSKIAKDFGLRVITGRSYTSGLTSDDEYNNEVLEQHYQPDIYEPKKQLAKHMP